MLGRKKQALILFLILAVLAALVTGCVLLAGVMRPSGGGDSFAVKMTEVLASNSAYPDDHGQYHDFVELRNEAGSPVDLSDYKLTDSQQTVKYQFPKGTVLESGAYLVVWCDATGADCAPFSIAKEGGEVLCLLNSKNVVVDTVMTLPTMRNIPMVRGTDGQWSLSAYATPGYENTQAGQEAYLKSRSAESYPVHLSEIAATNALYPAPDGGLYDFIEVHNTTAEAVDISGCRLSDTQEEAKFTFPSGTVLEAGGYLVVWCGGQGGASFGISAGGGETVCLLSPGGGVIDRVETLPSDGGAYALTDGGWKQITYCTPGFANSEEGSLAYLQSRGFDRCTVEVSEAMADNRSYLPQADGTFPDWIELHNAGTKPQTLTGYYLTDDEAEPLKWPLPEITLDAGEHLVILCDGKNTVEDGVIHAGFSLSSYGEAACLVTPAGTIASRLPVLQAESDRSTIAGETVTELPTPGYENTQEGWVAWSDAQVPTGAIAIWEVMSANDFYLRQSDGGYYDWVELKNISDQPVSLKNYTLTDKTSLPGRMVLPDVTLQPGQCYAVVLNGQTMGLDAEEDWVYLYANGVLQDCAHVKDVSYRGSFGRMAGQGGWFWFANATPSTENAYGQRGISQTPVPSLEAGVYEQTGPLTVSLSAPGTIYYTTDGSWPTTASAVYTAPFTITGTTVLRVMALEQGKLHSDVETLSYIVSEGHDLPVASLCLDPDDMFGQTNGIYVNYYKEWEKYANLSFFENGNSFSQDCGLTMFGSMSRKTNAKKSFKVLFRPRYEGALEYRLYEDLDVSSFSSLVLRAGQDYTSAIIREELMTSLADDASDSVQTQKSRYCVLYINGEYWGIYSIKEAFSQEYYANRNGVSPESVTVLRTTAVASSGTDLYPTMCYAVANDMDQAEHFQYIADRVDLESLADWVILQTYCGNSDILNNCRYIRSSEDDNKWHYAFYDLDWTFLVHANLTRSSLEAGTQFAMLPRSVLKNAEFREYFLKRLAYQLENTLSTENVLTRIDELAEEIRSEVPRERRRWGGSVQSWESCINSIKKYVTNPGRDQEVIDDFCRYLGVTAAEKQQYFG